MENLQLVQHMYQAFGRGDLPALLATFDPDLQWINPGPVEPRYFGTHRGPDAVARNVFGFLAENLAFEVFDPYEFFVSGDKVVALVRMEAVARRSGQRLVQQAAHVFTFRAGKLIGFYDFQNSHAVVEALRT
jgi:ketosteroid isomerase-like protein